MTVVGQRQDLLVGAKRCVAEKGYSRTTARDIVAASGANLAAIGYHFGSKDALLNAAILASFDEWGDAIEEAMVGPGTGQPIDRFERFLAGFLRGSVDRRATLVASVQMLAEAEFVPDAREQIVASYAQARRGLAAMLLGGDPQDVDDAGLALGSLVLAILNGVVLQWLVAPDAAPTAADLARAVRALASSAA